MYARSVVIPTKGIMSAARMIKTPCHRIACMAVLRPHWELECVWMVCQESVYGVRHNFRDSANKIF